MKLSTFSTAVILKVLDDPTLPKDEPMRSINAEFREKLREELLFRGVPPKEIPEEQDMNCDYLLTKRVIEEKLKKEEIAEKWKPLEERPVKEKPIKLTFSMSVAQYDTIKTALDKAGVLCGSDKTANQLDLICADWLVGVKDLSL
jgi:hypothetical protein